MPKKTNKKSEELEGGFPTIMPLREKKLKRKRFDKLLTIKKSLISISQIFRNILEKESMVVDSCKFCMWFYSFVL